MKSLLKLLSLFTIIILLGACNGNRVFEKNTGIDNYHWDQKDTIWFDVKVEDTALRYDLFINLRHMFQFPYSNVWLNLVTVFPDGKIDVQRNSLELGNNQKGKWLGECMGDICDRQVSVGQGIKLTQSGSYRFGLQHVMRDQPLRGIMSAGIRLEKSIGQP